MDYHTCTTCGKLKDDTDLLQSAIKYLKEGI